MKKSSKKKAVIGIGSFTVAVVCAAAVFALTPAQLSDNPWEHTLLSGETDGTVSADNKSFIVNGDIRSNGSILINSEAVKVNGYAAAVSSVTGILPEENIFEKAEASAFPDVYENVYSVADEYELTCDTNASYINSSLVLNDKAVSSAALNIDINSEYAPTSDETSEITGKIGAFGANFFTKTYSDPEKWSQILPVMYNSSDIKTTSLTELGQNSNFIPLRERAVDSSWSDYDKLSEAAISNNFSESNLTEYMSDLKSENPVTEICSEGGITIQANNSINPTEAGSAKKITVEGGHFSLNGEYSNLEEIKFNSWGGSQLIGNYPNLKYICKTTGSDLNLVGDFPSLECIYMCGGQLLIGSGDGGFNADGVKIINDYGPIAIYTAKDVTLTNSDIATTQMILVRGNGSDQPGAVFNSENTIMAARSGVMFEDMNDSNIRRFDKLPVYYSTYPMSINNCNFKLFQGTLINNNNAIITSNANINKFRGYMFSPDGIDEYRNSSAVGFYINTYAYNISPNINNLNKQPNGSEKIGRISEFEYAKFPRELMNKITDSDKFLADIQNKNVGFEIGESNKKPGELAIGKYIFAEGDINIAADTIVNRDDSIAVIASKSGNITINVTDTANIKAIIYAPHGKISINGNAYEIKGRIFAENIEINALSFEITGGSEDISYLGFVYDKKTDDTSYEPESSSDSSSTEATEDSSGSESKTESSSSETTSESSTESTSEESSKPEESSSESSGSESGFDNPQYEYDLLNRLVKVTYDDDNYIEYIYDANGNITKIVTVADGKEQ